MRLVLLGPPGVGKGTQAQAISARFQLPKIATGDMLRESIRTGDELGQKAAAHVEAGRLVPDALMISLVRQRLQREDCRAGFLLDGFPRTLPQAEALEEVLEDLDMMLERVLLFCIADEEKLVQRLSGRRVHPGSGRSYHVVFNPPQREGLDDVTGEPLAQREDDAEATVRHRLQVYHEQTEPLVGFYRERAARGAGIEFHTIDSDAPVQEVADRVRRALEGGARELAHGTG